MVLVTMLLCLANEPAPTAYALYDGQGKATTYAAMLDTMAGAEVVFFGELHNDAVAHWLELSVATALADRFGPHLALGAEMLERDQQLIVDEYLAGTIRSQDLTGGTKLWPNWADYAPLLDLAKARKLPFVASNVPRRYAALLSRDGWPALERLSSPAKALFAQLPVTVDTSLPGYQEILKMDTHGAKIKPELMVAAQALKDATMAESIHRAMPQGGCLLHFNGAYHSNGREGILWYLKRLRPGLRAVTLNTVQAAEVTRFPGEAKGTADFVLVTAAGLVDKGQE